MEQNTNSQTSDQASDNSSKKNSSEKVEGNSSFNNSASNNNAASNNAAFLEQLKFCLPSVSDITSGISAGITTLISLVKDTKGTLANSASEEASWATQVRTYLLPLALVMGLAGFVKGSFIGHSLPFLGNWTEPIFAGFIYHAMQAIVMVIGIALLPVFLTKTLSPTDSSSNILSLLKTTMTPSMIGSWFVILGGLGSFIGLAGGLFGLYALWQGSLVISERNPNISATKFLGMTIVGGILIGVLSMLILAPLLPTNLSSFPRP